MMPHIPLLLKTNHLVLGASKYISMCAEQLSITNTVHKICTAVYLGGKSYTSKTVIFTRKQWRRESKGFCFFLKNELFSIDYHTLIHVVYI